MKKKLAATLSVVLILGLAVLGILAYLQDDDSDVNVMTLGNVSIEQHEYQRVVNEDGTYATDTIDNRTSYVLEDFEQGKPLYPAIIPNNGSFNGVSWAYDGTPVRMSQVGSHGGASVFNTPNAQDKFVTVENIGKSDAYVRTIVALEVGTAEIESDEYPDEPLISSEIRAAKAENNTNGKQPWTYGFAGYVTIDGNKYLVYELVYTGALTSSGWKHENGVLPAGETTYPNLCQVYMASRATNEDVEAIDGNKNGTYDIFVLSQAVQTAGFDTAKTALDTAFGESNEENIKAWFEGTEIPTAVATAEELTSALAAGTDVYLTDDVTLDADVALTVAKGASAEINLNGNTLSGSSKAIGKNRNLMTVKGDLTVSNGTVTMTHTGDDMGWNNLVSAFSVEGGELTLNDVTINASGSAMAYGVDVNTTLGETVLNIEGNTTITSSYTGVRIFNNHKTAKGTINFNSGKIEGTSRDIWVHNPSASAVDANGIVNIADSYTYSITVQDTFNNSRIYQID